MDAGEPRVRRRGMFSHPEIPEIDEIETESAEGITARIARRKSTRIVGASRGDGPTRRGDDLNRPIRFATATGSRRLSAMPR